MNKIRSYKKAEPRVMAAMYELADCSFVVRASQSEIAELCGVSRETIKLSYRALKHLGFIEEVRHGRARINPVITMESIEARDGKKVERS